MKALIFGRTGQVAIELGRHAPDGATLTQLGREVADLGDAKACAGIVAEADADILINAAAYTAVDKAEEESALARAVNATAPAAMARAAAARDLPFLHISTDYVFDGSGTAPWRPSDPPAPLGVYGRTKLAGEEGVRSAGGPHAILRTSWVFSAHGGNFVKTMLRLGGERGRLSIVADQIGGPTWAGDIADTLWQMAKAFAAGEGRSGVFHYASSPAVSWAGFARDIFARAGLRVEVAGIPTSAWPTSAARPLNSRLDGAALTRDYGIPIPDWHAGLEVVLKELEFA